MRSVVEVNDEAAGLVKINTLNVRVRDQRWSTGGLDDGGLPHLLETTSGTGSRTAAAAAASSS